MRVDWTKVLRAFINFMVAWFVISIILWVFAGTLMATIIFVESLNL